MGQTSLRSVDPNNVSNVPRKDLITKCRVVNVHDGDTITIIYMIDKKVPFKINLRMEGIDAPEITSKNQLERIAAVAVTKWLRRKINEQKYWWVILKRWDKYGGRVIGTLYTDRRANSSINQIMLDNGLVMPYDGGKKEAWGDKRLKEIVKSKL